MSFATSPLIPGLLLLAAGLLAFLWPERAWRPLFARGSRWANQASTAGLLVFTGLGWLGLMLLIVYSGALWLGWRSERWVAVEGAVVESRLVETRQVRSTNPAYRAQVVYRYEADGRVQHGLRTDFANASTPDRAWVEEALRARYAPGAAVTVFVDPGDGAQSVLYPGVPAKAVILCSLGLVFVGIAAWQSRALLRDWEGDGLAPVESRRRNRGRKR